MEPESLRELERQKLWFEWKVLRHLRSVFSESLNHLPEMAHVVAIESRYVGEAALRRDDRAVVAVVVKYFNTYLRGALNGHDVRACYNIFNQYRLLAELLLRQGWSELALTIAQHFAYYGPSGPWRRDGLCHRDFGPRSGLAVRARVRAYLARP